MIALVILFFLAIYLLITAVVMGLAARWAKRHGRRGWVWAGVAAFGMYNLVFWDLIPTLLVHKYYCETQAGFWVYKTPEEWAQENPGVLGTLEPWPASKVYGKEKTRLKINGMAVDQYNDIFGYWRKHGKPLPWLPVFRSESGIIDIKARELISRRVSFSSGPGGPGEIGKFWLRRDRCGEGKVLAYRQAQVELSRHFNIEE